MLGFQIPLRQRSRGFTLIEIMVVVVIVGIAISVAIANLVPDERELLRQESERVLALLETVRDESALGGRAIAVRLKDNRLEFLERDPHAVQPQWQAAGAEGLKTRAVAEGIAVDLKSGGKPVTDDQVITFLPAGVGVPFSLTLRSSHYQRVIDGDPLGNLSMTASDVAS